MKISTILVGTAATIVASQSLPSGFPQCGVTCITNMLGLAGTFGCDASDATCLCSAVNFLYGVRDCADQACPSTSDAQTVKDYGLNYCANAGVAVSGISGSVTATGSPSTTIVATASPITQTGTAPPTTETGTPITTSFIVSDSVGTDGNTTPTTVGTTTILGSTGSSITTVTTTSTDTSSATTGSSETSTFETTVPTTTTTGGTAIVSSIVQTGTTTEGSSATGTGSASGTGNGAAQQTVAPIGLLAAAVAVLMM